MNDRLDTPRRLLIIADAMEGGLGLLVRDHARWFTERGWEVVLAGNTNGSPAGIRGFDVQIPGTARAIGDMAKASFAVSRFCSVFCPEIIHCHGLRSFAIATMAGRRAFVSIHGPGSLPGEPAWATAARRRALRLIPRIALGAFTANPAPQPGWTFHPYVSPRLRDLKKLSFPRDTAPVFLWIGRLESQKRPEMFVEVIAHASKESPVLGIIVGGGSQEREVRRLAMLLRAPIDFVGDTSDIADYLARSWAVVLFSRFEGMPLSLMEAMWSGRAVVTSRLDGLQWLVGDGGILVEDMSEAVSAIRGLCEPDVAEAMGERAAARIRTLVSPDMPGPAVAEAYDSVLARSRRP